jgi:MoxR-like ATPase
VSLRLVSGEFGVLKFALQLARNVMRFEGTSAYVATEDLKVAVNAAIALERPLLVKGEPGTGKTVLAIEIAKALSAR